MKSTKNRPYLEVEVITNGRKGHQENPTKMKFPFYCYYSKDGLTKRLGLVDVSGGCYFLIDMAIQKKKREDVDQGYDLEELIKDNHINTVKVKLIVFE